MKTILVDAINGLILEDGTVFHAMYDLLEQYPNDKIVLTGAKKTYMHSKFLSTPTCNLSKSGEMKQATLSQKIG